MIELTVVIPIRNEAPSLEDLHRELAATLDAWGRPYEVIVVDDGSTDESFEILARLQAIDSHVRVIRLRRNFGQTAAFAAGFEYARGRYIATLDGDLQNDPADLPRLFAELENVDFVCGWRVIRRDNWLRRISSGIARRARKIVLGADFRDTGCALRAFRRAALDGVFPFNGWHRFLPILVQDHGTAIKEIPVHHRPRAAGVSKYGVWNRLGRGIYDLIGVRWYRKRRLRSVPIIGLGEQ